MVLASWDIIEEYLATIGATPALFEVQNRFVPNTNLVTAKVVTQGEFTNRVGILVEKHYLQLNYGDKVRGFGLSKAEALLSYRVQIEFLVKS